MKAEIIMIGTELLLGQIVDTNASYLARQLAETGFNLYHKTTVGDNDNRITESIRNALLRSDVVITSGGLGPTVDDKTREAVASATGRQLLLDQELLKHVANFFKKRGMELGENNKRQAYIPQNAIPIHNPVGTAPGFIVEYHDKYVISLPGVPHELHHLTENTVIPFLQKAFGIETLIKTRLLKTAGVGESNVDRLISDLEESENPTVGLAAHLGSVDIRISAKAKNLKDADMLLEQMEQMLRNRLGDIIYGTDQETIEGVVVDLLKNRGLSLAVLETNTGGELASRLTSVPGGYSILSQALCAGVEQVPSVIPCDSTQKQLHSPEGAERLAILLREKTASNIGVAIIGDEDSDVGPYSKQTGNTYLGVSTSDKIVSKHIQLGGISNFARIRITSIVLDKLRRFLLQLPTFPK
jgi:nicotinamide-nucleotide amidase